MQGLDVNCSAGMIHLYQILPAPPNWYALFNDGAETSFEPIAAFGLIYGPNGRELRLVGLSGSDNDLTPIDCFMFYTRTVYKPCPKEAKHCGCLEQ